MKILLLHANYTLPGGEDAVFNLECQLLSRGHEVKIVAGQNLTGIKGGVQFLFSLWNLKETNSLKVLLKTFKPDILHIHNFHFSFGPAIIRMAFKLNVPVVVTIHNYRFLCPSATLVYNSTLFRDSIHSAFPYRAVTMKVYRNSYFQTFWLAFIFWFHKRIGTWHMVRSFIVLTTFARDLHINSNFGVAMDKFVVKPNFTFPVTASKTERGEHFLFVGRLTEEKGLNVLLDTFNKTDKHLYIVGDGPLRKYVEDLQVNMPNIHYLGALNKDDVIIQMQKCSALIFPSVWYEGLPMTIIESFAVGTPVIASNLGAMSSLITHGFNGRHFEVGDTDDLIEQLNYWGDLSIVEWKKYSEQALSSYKERFTPEQNLLELNKIYSNAVKKQL